MAALRFSGLAAVSSALLIVGCALGTRIQSPGGGKAGIPMALPTSGVAEANTADAGGGLLSVMDVTHAVALAKSRVGASTVSFAKTLSFDQARAKFFGGTYLGSIGPNEQFFDVKLLAAGPDFDSKLPKPGTRAGATPIPAFTWAEFCIRQSDGKVVAFTAGH